MNTPDISHFCAHLVFYPNNDETFFVKYEIGV